MTGSDEESTTFNEPTERKKKKKKQKNEDSEKSESQGHNNENTMMKKKQQKKKAEATEDVPEIMDVVPKKKKKNNKMLQNIASSDPNKNGDVPKKKMGDPTSAERTHKKKKKKNVLAQESSPCDPQTNEDVPKKKKKKSNIEDAGSLELESIDLGHKNDESAALEDSKEIVTTKKKKRKKSKPAENKSEDGAPGTEDILIDVSDVKKKKRKEAPELEEKSGSPTEDQPETSDHAKVKKKKKKKATSVKTEEVIEDHDVHHGEEGGGSQRVSKKKKKSQGSNIVHRESDLKGNGDEDRDVPPEEGLKKKRENRADKTTELVDGTEKSCCEEAKSTKKRKKEMQKHTDESHCANEDRTEVPKKKKKNKETKNSKGANKKQEESTDAQLVSARDGNADEAHGDPVRRKASADTDRESGNTKGTKFGQWDTAAFQNPEQQSKFFRLLGGFKKGNQETSGQVRANMALAKEGEQALERNLLVEFDKAVSWKQNRGIGLGFQPAPNKVFYIDKTRSRSVKFDD